MEIPTRLVLWRHLQHEHQCCLDNNFHNELPTSLLTRSTLEIYISADRSYYMICHIWNGYIIWIISYAACDMLKLISSSWNYVGYEHGCSEHLEIFFLQQVDQQTFGPYKIYSFGELHHFYSLLFQYYTVQYEHNRPLLKVAVRLFSTGFDEPTVLFILEHLLLRLSI